MVIKKRRMKTGDSLWKQAYQEQHGETRNREENRGWIELIKNHRDSYLDRGGRLKKERNGIYLSMKIDGDITIIESGNEGFPWLDIDDFEVVGRDTKAHKASRSKMKEAVSGKELGRLQVFKLADLKSDGTRDFEIKFHCKNFEGKERSLRIFNWNEDGSYDIEILKKKVKGTHWIIRIGYAMDVVPFREYVNEQLRFFDTPYSVDLNGDKFTYTPPTKSEVARRISHKRKVAINGFGTAYINPWGNGNFDVYNLGIKLRTPLNINMGGISGTIVTTAFLPEDLGRSSLVQDDIRVQKIIDTIKKLGRDMLISALLNKPGRDLTGSQRESLLKMARHDIDLRKKIETKLIIDRGNGSYTSISRIAEKGNLWWAQGSMAIIDKAIQKGYNVVEHNYALERLLVDDFGICILGDIEDNEEMMQYEHKYKYLETTPEIEEFFEEIHEYMIAGMRRGIDSQETPEFRVGKAGDSSVTGWTDSEEYIAFRKDMVEADMKEAGKITNPADRLEFIKDCQTISTLVHEIGHWHEGDDSITVGAHSDDFKEAEQDVKWVIHGALDEDIKEALRQETPKLAEWDTKVKYRKGGDGKLIFQLAIPRTTAEELELTQDSIVRVSIETISEMDEDYSKVGYRKKDNT